MKAHWVALVIGTISVNAVGSEEQLSAQASALEKAFRNNDVKTAQANDGSDRVSAPAVKRHVTVARLGENGKTETFCTDNVTAARGWLQQNRAKQP